MATQNQPAQELRERPLGEVAKDLTNDLSLLVRQEVELARAEMTLKARRAAPASACSAGPDCSPVLRRLVHGVPGAGRFPVPARMGGSGDRLR